MNLASKYRPIIFEDIVEQEEIKKIIKYSLETETFKNVSLFVGGAGTGKTTTARIVANLLDIQANIIEIDGASNNGIDNVRMIIDDSKTLPLVGDKKIYIIDECHQLSKSAWDALLKLLEEPPRYFYILFCTTDPQKIPGTILSRVQRYDFRRITQRGVLGRLKYITEQEKVEVQEEVLDYIAKVAEGGMRTAISLLDKGLDYSKKLTTENMVKALGVSKYESNFKLLKSILNQDKEECLKLINIIYDSGEELKRYVTNFSVFLIEVNKGLIYLPASNIPPTYHKLIKKYADWENEINTLANNFVALDSELKYCQYVRQLIEISCLKYIEEIAEGDEE